MPTIRPAPGGASLSAADDRDPAPPPLDRRRFVGLLLGAVAAGWRLPAGAGEAVRIGLVLPAGHPAAAAVRAGAELGAAEARRLAELVGSSFALEVREAAGVEAVVAAGRELIAAGARAVAGGVERGCCEALAAALPAMFLELRARREAAPRPGPAPRHLAVSPAYRDYAAALARGLARAGLRRVAFAGEAPPVLRRAAAAAGLAEVAAGEAQAVLGGEPRRGGPVAAGVTLAAGPGTAVPVAWHPSLRRYGGSELNERFAAAAGRPMDGDAWSGWFAVKLLVETALRGRPWAEARLDGHKGVPLAFAAERLRQPLYVALQRGDGEPEVIDA